MPFGMASTEGRRSSAGEQMASAVRRVSLAKKLMAAKVEPDAERIELGERNRDVRRRESLKRMFVTDSGRALTTSLLRGMAGEEDVRGTPVERLQQILTKAKERGMSAERLFEYFAPEGESSITADAFESALQQLLGRDVLAMEGAEVHALMDTFDTDKNGTIELSEFMEFCFSIPSLAWKAERARRLSNGDSTDSLAEAARNAERRRSSLKAVSLGRRIHEGAKLFWRTKEDLDVAIYENAEEGLFFIFCRCHSKAVTYPPIFVEARKVPISTQDAAKALQRDLAKRCEAFSEAAMADGGGEYAEAVEAKRLELAAEYLLNRLKMPDGINVPTAAPAHAAHGTEEKGGSGGGGGGGGDGGGNGSGESKGERYLQDKGGDSKADAEVAATAAATAMATLAGGGDGCPFLQRLSTDAWDSLLTRRSVVLEHPHRFPTRRRSSMQDFRRTSAEFDRIAKETAALSLEAQGKSNDAVERARRVSQMDISKGR